jgi:hypothetical protein
VSTTGVSLDLARELRAICGDEYVVEGDSEGAAALSVSPGSADEVAAIVRLANRGGFSIAPVGGQSELALPLKTDVLLSVHRLTEVEHYDPADLTVGVGAGMTVSRLNALVAGGKLMFACDPAFPELTTVGGVLAAAKHGPMRHGYGGVRDFCIGIRFVTGDGRKAKSGGHVVKNVAGYDLMKLLIGSYGTLAIITSASFKLFPALRQTRTFLAEFSTWQEALKFRDQVVRSPLSPMCLEIVSPQARKMMRPEMSDDAWVICIRAAGSDVVLERYRKELGVAVTREIEGEGERKMWSALANFPYLDVRDVPPGPISRRVQPINVMAPPSEMSRVVEAAAKCDRPGEMGCAFIGRIGIGHLLVYSWPIHPEAFRSPTATADELQKSLPDSVKITIDSFPTPWRSAPAHLPSLQAVKRALDSNTVLRGRELF